MKFLIEEFLKHFNSLIMIEGKYMSTRQGVKKIHNTTTLIDMLKALRHYRYRESNIGIFEMTLRVNLCQTKAFHQH